MDSFGVDRPVSAPIRSRWRTRRRWALASFVVMATVLASTALIVMAISRTALDLAAALATVATTAVGARILDQRPGNPIGRISLGLGGVLVVATLLQLVAITLDRLSAERLDIVGAMAVISSTMSGLAMSMGMPLLLSRFPDGRRMGRVGRLLEILVLAEGIALVFAASRPRLLEYDWIRHVHNPLALDIDVPQPILDAANVGAFVTILVVYFLVTVTLGLRYGAGDRTVRAQVRWVGLAAAVTAILFFGVIASVSANADVPWLWNAWIVSTTFPSLAIGAAVLRYRLYDLDRIVSQTIGYAVVTAILGLGFVGANIVVVQFGANSIARTEIGVAVTTLIVAAGFSPIRRRVQVLVDQRFHRTGYDAEGTVDAVRRRLRDEVEPDVIRGVLVEAIASSIEPATAGVWLRAPVTAAR